MILLGAFITATVSAWVYFYLYRRRGISKRIACSRNCWNLRISDLAKLIFYIPFLPRHERLVVQQNLNWIVVQEIRHHKKMSAMPITEMPLTKKRTEKTLTHWKLLRCKWLALVFLVAFGLFYSVMSLQQYLFAPH